MMDDDTYPFYNIWYLGHCIDSERYPTRELAQAAIDALPEYPNIALVDEDPEIEEWTEENHFKVILDDDDMAWVLIETDQQMAKFARLGGWNCVPDFEKKVGHSYESIKGKWFRLVGDKLTLRDEDRLPECPSGRPSVAHLH